MTGGNLLFTGFVLVSLVLGFCLREIVRAFVAQRLGDPTAAQYGWIRLNMRSIADPLGTVIIPILALVLIAAGKPLVPPFAYAKPFPLDPHRFRRPGRDVVLVSIAGPLANLALAGLAGLALRIGSLSVAAEAALWVNLTLCFLHLMPIPGLDGARMLGRVLPDRPAEVYRNLDPYLPLFILVIFFLFGGILLAILDALVGIGCSLLAGAANCP